jgi:hypothetical protein
MRGCTAVWLLDKTLSEGCERRLAADLRNEDACKSLNKYLFNLLRALNSRMKTFKRALPMPVPDVMIQNSQRCFEVLPACKKTAWTSRTKHVAVSGPESVLEKRQLAVSLSVL